MIAVVAAACVRFTTFGTATGPIDTTSATAEAVATLVPAAGFWLITLPEGTVVLDCCETVPTTRPALTIAAVAAVCVKFTTFGTATGPGVAGWSLGEPVMGFIDPFQRAQGTFAEFVPVPAPFVSRRPASIDHRLGAALPCVGITAVTLCDLAHVGRDSRVLVNGASGGVGHLAVQVAKARGARVTAVASTGRRDFVTSLGADAFIDYRTTPATEWPGGFDAVLDCVPSLPRSTHARLLRRGGHYASTLPGAATYTIDPVLNRLGRLVRRAVMLQPNEPAMRELVRYVEQGSLRCEIAGEYALKDTNRAIEASRRGHVAGKLLIRVA